MALPVSAGSRSAFKPLTMGSVARKNTVIHPPSEPVETGCRILPLAGPVSGRNRGAKKIYRSRKMPSGVVPLFADSRKVGISSLEKKPPRSRIRSTSGFYGAFHQGKKPSLSAGSPSSRTVLSPGKGRTYPGRTPKPFDTLIRIPLYMAVSLLFLIISSGFLDSFVMRRPPVQAEIIPGDSEPAIPVLKASIEMPSLSGTVSELVLTRHKVGRDENISRIAYDYGLSPSTLISINLLEGRENLDKGSFLLIPYRDGIRVSGDDVTDVNLLAGKYQTEAALVQTIPGTDDYFVSGGITVSESLSPDSSGDVLFVYPVIGRILTGYGEAMDNLTGIPYRSEGIDLVADAGEPIRASRSGEVILTGHHSSYGLYVIIRHSGGWKSFYGHLGRIDVAPGDILDSRSILGIAGSTGTARSSRLHFAMFHDGESVDPLDYLY